MGKKDNKEKVNMANLKVNVVKNHLNTYKYLNEDLGTLSFVIPREQLRTKFIGDDTKELEYNFIYFLIGLRNGKYYFYVGQACKRENGQLPIERLREHDKASREKESYCNMWDYVVAITGVNNTWKSDTICALEHIFYHEIPEEIRLNNRKPSSKCDADELEKCVSKVEQVKAYIKAVGYPAFEFEDDKEEVDENKELIEITLKNEVTEDIQSGMSSIPEIITPRRLVKQMVDMLPEEVWNEHTKFLDPACKGGEFLREIHDRLMQVESLQVKYPNDIERSNYIAQNQLYGIALSKLSADRTKKKLLGHGENIKVIPNYINRLKYPDDYVCDMDGKNSNTLRGAIAKAFNLRENEMKFEVVIGNPPYNDTDKTGSSESISALFVELGRVIDAKYISFIMPCRWFASVDSLNRQCRESMVGKLKYLRDFKDASCLFKNVNIAGGVSYFLYDRDYNGNMVYEDETGRIETIHNNEFMCRGVVSNMLFNHVKNKETAFMNEKWISTSFFGLKRSSRGRSIKTETDNIRLRSSGELTFISLNDIKNNKDAVDKYKVAIPYSSMTINPLVLEPNEVCTLTYLVVRLFGNKVEAENCKKYLETKFVKILFNGLKSKLGTTKENLQLIPLQDFTSNSDIDWEQSISEIDEQLYKKYGLTEKEIEIMKKA